MNDEEGIYFLTMTVVEWADVFTRSIYKEDIIQSFQYCMAHKGLRLHAYIIMSNHLHLVISRQTNGAPLSDIIRDLKKFTAKKIIASIKNNPCESRKRWLLELFRRNGKTKGIQYQFWQHHNHPISLYTPFFMRQKINYIHQNPVKAGIVYQAQDYIHSSAAAYLGIEEGVLDVEILEDYFSFDRPY